MKMKRDGCYKILKWLFNRDFKEFKCKLFNKGDSGCSFWSELCLWSK